MGREAKWTVLLTSQLVRPRLGGWEECLRASTCLLGVEAFPVLPCVTLIRCWLTDRKLAGVDAESLLHSDKGHGLRKARGTEQEAESPSPPPCGKILDVVYPRCSVG